MTDRPFPTSEVECPGNTGRRSTPSPVRFRESAEAERDRLYSVFMQAPMPVAILRGPDFVYELSNPANQRYLNHQDVVGKPLRELENIPAEIFQLLNRVYSTGERVVGKAFPVEFILEGKPKLHYVDFVYEPIRDQEGAVDAILVSGNDVTDAVTAQERAEEKEAHWWMRCRRSFGRRTPKAVFTISIADGGSTRDWTQTLLLLATESRWFILTTTPG